MARKYKVIQDGGGKVDDVSIFDDLDALRDAGPEPATAHRRTRLTETFARVPHDRALALLEHDIGSAGWAILVELDRLILIQRGRNPVRLTNSNLRRFGLDHYRKRRALRKLEQAWVISVERGVRQAPLVTHHWFPIQRNDRDRVRP